MPTVATPEIALQQTTASTDIVRRSFHRGALALAIVLAPLTTLVAQESPFAAAMKTTLIEPAAPAVPAPFIARKPAGRTPVERPHRFWDRENTLLFAGVAVMNTADFWATRNNLSHGGRELNPLTRPFAGSTAGLAFNFTAETAGYIGASYIFHKTGHHKLERIASLVSIGGSAGAVAYDLSHR